MLPFKHIVIQSLPTLLGVLFKASQPMARQNVNAFGQRPPAIAERNHQNGEERGLMWL